MPNPDRIVAIRMPHGIVLRPVPATVALPGPAATISGEDAAQAEVDETDRPF